MSTTWTTDFVRCLGAEFLKLRRTPALMLAIIAPFLPAMLFFTIAWRRGLRLLNGSNVDIWQWLLHSNLTIWIAVLMPLTIALVAELLDDLETRGLQWKHLFAMPVRRSAVYAAKQAIGMLLLAFSTALLLLFAWAVGRVVHLREPALGFGEPFPIDFAAPYFLAAIIAGSLLTAFHTWMAMRWKSFVPGLAIGFLGMSLAGVLKAHDLWPWFPWRITLDVLGKSADGPAWTGPLLALCVALPFTVFAAWDNTRRDVV